MNEIIRTQLKQAYDLIKQRDFVAARPLIADVLRNDRGNVDAWWLAVFVAENPDDKRIALEKVLRLKPDHAAAQEMLTRIEQEQRAVQAAIKSPPRQTGTLPVMRQAPRKRGIRWGAWTLRLAGFLCFSFAGLVVVDNFTGGKYTGWLERLVLGDPDTDVWAGVDSGGMVSEDVNRDDRIPVVKEVRLDRKGDFQFDVIRKDEAHLYHFYSSAGSELMIMANFSSGGGSPIKALELWDTNGRVIARDERLVDMISGVGNPEAGEFGSLVSPRAIQYTTRYSGEYTVAVIARDGGAAGNYTLIIDTLENIANRDIEEFMR